MGIAIRMENIGKRYHLGKSGTGTMAHDIHRWWMAGVMQKSDPYRKVNEMEVERRGNKSREVWALKNINLEVKEGEVLGIIGNNGAGKSTLLKILSRVTSPTTGRILMKGRLASLLEVGTGFHPEMTGRENIFMNGAIMGMKKEEIRRKLDEIVDFSGIGQYIDTPVKRYSSGMTVRLGFSVAAHLDPDILVVDEVLAVGDAEFQKKAIGKMQDVTTTKGRTVLFVSHNFGLMRKLCTQGLILCKGEVINVGDSTKLIDYYISKSQKISTQPIDKRKDRNGNQYLKITNLKIYSLTGVETNTIRTGECFRILLEISNIYNIKAYNVAVGVSFTDINDTPISLIHNRLTGDNISVTSQKCIIECTIENIPLNIGHYYISTSLIEDNGFGKYYDGINHAAEIEIIAGNYYKTEELPLIQFGPLLTKATFKMK